MPEATLEVREFKADSITDEGVFEGYLTTWDTIDSYRSLFKKGSFSRTIEERASKIKIFYDHTDLIGKCTEIREDSKGVFGKGKLNLSCQKALETLSFMKDGTLEGLSFGFTTAKDEFVEGIRNILEIDLFEFGPVCFPAGPTAKITDVRAMNIMGLNPNEQDGDWGGMSKNDKQKWIDLNKKLDESKNKERAIDFDQTVADEDLTFKGGRLLEALGRTLMDIWFSNFSSDETVNLLDEAISSFQSEYIQWATQLVSDSNTRSIPFSNSLSKAFNDYLTSDDLTINELCMKSSLTQDEVEKLSRGVLIDDPKKIEQLGDPVQKEYRKLISSNVEHICKEVRTCMDDAQKTRLLCLLKNKTTEIKTDDFSPSVTYLTDFTKQLGDRNA